MTSEQYSFCGQTTFIDKPINTVISDFQNTYVSGTSGDEEKALKELTRLVELLLSSKELPSNEKDDAVKAVHGVAEQVKSKQGSKLTLKGTLNAIADLVSKAADIAGPAVAIISAVTTLLGLG